jgi:phage anti-repressor protein
MTTLPNIAIARLNSQQLTGSTLKSAKDLVAFMGAMQAQDYAMSKLAIGVRLPASTDKIIQDSIDKGEILRTHVMRPTWHFVSSDDIHWMLELTAPRIKSLLKSRQKELGLSETIITKSFSVMENLMQNGHHATRDELHLALKKEKIATDENRLSHLMMSAELDGIVCSGSMKNNKQTYALLDERVKRKKNYAKEEALAELAKRYFLSHGPATVKDFAWWAGLSLGDARKGLELVKSNFFSETIDEETYWFAETCNISQQHTPSIHLLPAFDEFIISYKNRSASLPLEHHVKVVSNNGIFRPVIVLNGKVTGLWKKTLKNDKVMVETELFVPHNNETKKMLYECSNTLGHFWGQKAKLI